MVFQIMIPDAASPSSAKDAVIAALSQEWPLSVRELHNRIKARGLSVTYQAVYKAVHELVDLKVLAAKDRRYEISMKWVKRVQEFTDALETNFYTKNQVSQFAGLSQSSTRKGFSVLIFSTILDAEKYLYYFLKQALSRMRDVRVVERTNYFWKPHYYYRAEYNHYRKMSVRGHTFHFVCTGNAAWMREQRRFYEALGIGVRSAQREAAVEEIAFADHCIQVFMPRELREDLRAALSRGERLPLLEDVLSRKSEIKVIIHKDAEMAREAQERILS